VRGAGGAPLEEETLLQALPLGLSVVFHSPLESVVVEWAALPQRAPAHLRFACGRPACAVLPSRPAHVAGRPCSSSYSQGKPAAQFTTQDEIITPVSDETQHLLSAYKPPTPAAAGARASLQLSVHGFRSAASAQMAGAGSRVLRRAARAFNVQPAIGLLRVAVPQPGRAAPCSRSHMPHLPAPSPAAVYPPSFVPPAPGENMREWHAKLVQKIRAELGLDPALQKSSQTLSRRRQRQRSGSPLRRNSRQLLGSRSSRRPLHSRSSRRRAPHQPAAH
jgi:hypothetical protein